MANCEVSPNEIRFDIQFCPRYKFSTIYLWLTFDRKKSDRWISIFSMDRSIMLYRIWSRRIFSSDESYLTIKRWEFSLSLFRTPKMNLLKSRSIFYLKKIDPPSENNCLYYQFSLITLFISLAWRDKIVLFLFDSG